MRTNPGVDTLNFDDLYNNLRVFESDVKGSTGSSTRTPNVAFVSSDNTSITNEVNTTYESGDQKGIMTVEKRDAGNTGYKAKDNGKRSAKHDEHKAMVNIDGDGVDWTVMLKMKQRTIL
nr:hypothetical protein [Tanacetum cinerariifolium]